jgi:hypothetical protein
MSFFTTTKTSFSILLKFIILVITTLIIQVILIFLTIASLVLTIWSWIILLISKLIIWCIIFYNYFCSCTTGDSIYTTCTGTISLKGHLLDIALLGHWSILWSFYLHI